MMNDIERSYYEMIKLVLDIMNEYATIWTGNAPCAGLKAELDAAFAGMNQSLSSSYNQAAGKVKTITRNALEAATLPIAQGLSAYAAITGNADLQQSSKVTERDLSRAAGVGLLGIVKRITDLATAHLAALGPYGVTADMISDCNDRATAFSNMLDAPAAAQRQRKELTGAVTRYRKEAVAVCKQLDLLVPTFQSASKDFVWRYKQFRRLTKPGHRKRALQVRITDAAGKPIADAMLSIPSLKVKRKSTDKGQAYFQHLHPGNHTLRIDAAGYAMKEVPVIIVANERTISDVMLVAE